MVPLAARQALWEMLEGAGEEAVTAAVANASPDASPVRAEDSPRGVATSQGVRGRLRKNLIGRTCMVSTSAFHH